MDCGRIVEVNEIHQIKKENKRKDVKDKLEKVKRKYCPIILENEIWHYEIIYKMKYLVGY